jgi:hypothetical protein
MAKNTASAPSGKAFLEVLNPRGLIEAKKTFAPTPRVKDLAGKRVGLYWNNKPGMDNFFTVFEDDAEAWRNEIDTFVYGVGD